jgi:hypothetical protein
MKLTERDFQLLWHTGSNWQCPRFQSTGRFVELYHGSHEDPKVRTDKAMKSIFWFKEYSSVLFARQYLEQEGIDHQVLSDESIMSVDNVEEARNWPYNFAIIADIDLGYGACECKECKAAAWEKKTKKTVRKLKQSRKK